MMTDRPYVSERPSAIAILRHIRTHAHRVRPARLRPRPATACFFGSVIPHHKGRYDALIPTSQGEPGAAWRTS